MRIVDADLLAAVRELPCLCCQSTPCHPHHVTSRGAGGHDEATNVMPLCQEHHSQWHQEGPGHMAKNYPAVFHWLKLAGRDDILSRVLKSGDYDWEANYGVG